MSNPIRRKETKILPSSMLDSGMSYHGKPVMQTETISELEESNPAADLSDLMLPEELKTRMFSHQVEGLQWLYGLHYSHPGGILGDDMGLGKTFQVSCLLTGLMRSNKIQRALIIAPVSVLPSWNRELIQHLAPYVKRVGIEMCSSEMSKKKRQKVLSDVFASRNCKIVISSYNLVANMTDDFVGGGSWDYVILDEGHIIKNPTTKLSKSMHMLKSNHRLILTGTPIQNNLIEFWALVNWATSGNLLGTKAHFKARFVDPILAGQEPKASIAKIEESKVAAGHLMRTIQPILLQRKKCEHTETLKLKKKVELVVWIPLSTTQRIVYEKYLRKRTVQDAMERKNFAVDVINDLKTISRHPFLMEASEALKKANGKDTMGGRTRDDMDLGSLEHALNSLSIDQNKRGGREERGADEEEEEGFNIGRAKDSRFNTAKPRTQPAYTAQSAHKSAQGREMNCLDDEDEYDDADSSRLGRKIGANASVFEVAGRKPEIEELFQDSVKLRVMIKLTQRLKRAGHRLLVFSQSKKMLDIIQKVLSSYGMSSCRIDGSVTGRDRQMIIDDFNAGGEDEEEGEDGMWDSTPKGGRKGMGLGPSICLLTTKACGQGITLTGADRVIIFDPSWNPAEDRQAVDRAFRIGQKKDVVVYRLIMASSVEEKMYEKQVFKDGVRIVTESGSSSRYFSSAETKELFTLGPPDKSEVMERLWAMTGTQLRSFEDTGGDLPKVCGYTRHDTLYTEARPEDVQNRTGQKGRGVGTLSSYKPNPPTHPTYSQESRSRDLDPHTGERRGANPMDKWMKPAAHPREARPGLPSARPTIDLSQDRSPPDCRRIHEVGIKEREEEYDFEDMKTGLAPAAVKFTPAPDQSERAQFWASVGSDESDADADSEEGDVDVGLGFDPQLDLDHNGENGGSFESSGFLVDDEEEPVRGPKSSIRVVRTSILMGRDYYSRPGEGEKSGVCQSRCLTDEDYTEQLHRERDAASGQADARSVGATMYPMIEAEDDDGDSDGGQSGSKNPNYGDGDVIAEGDASAEDASYGEDESSGCGAALSRESSPTRVEEVGKRSAALAMTRFSVSEGNRMRLPEECERGESDDDDNHDDDDEGDGDCDESCSDSVTVKAVRTPRDPGSRPIADSATLSDSRSAIHSPDAARGGAEEDGWASEGDALGGDSGRGIGHGAERQPVSETECRGCEGTDDEKKTTIIEEVEAEDFEDEVEVEVEIEGIVEEAEGAATWSAEDSSDLEGAEGVSEGVIEGEEQDDEEDEGSLEAILRGYTAADISSALDPCDTQYAALSASHGGCRRDTFEAYQEIVSKSCQEEGEELSVAESEMDTDSLNECDQSRRSRLVGRVGTGEQEIASSADFELSRSERRCSSWTALSPGAAQGDLDLYSDPHLEGSEGPCPTAPPRRSLPYPCPAPSGAEPLNKTMSDRSSGGHVSPRRPTSGPGAAYHTPGRVVLHVQTPHSTRGFCVALDSDSDSDGEECSDSNPHCASSPPDDEEGEGEGDGDTISPLGRSPLPMPRDKDTAESGSSTPFSLPMSPMSASTINSAVTSFSLSPHAIRSLALARLNLGTESNLKLCPSTMAPQTGKNFRGSRACDLVRVRLEGTAFEASPPRETLPASIREHSAALEGVDRSTGARGKEVFGRCDDSRRAEVRALESDEVSQADTVHLDFDRDTPSPTPAKNVFQKGNQSRAVADDDDDDDDEWVPKSACRRRLVKLSHGTEPYSDSEEEEEAGSVSTVSAIHSPAAALTHPVALEGQRDRSRVINLEDSDDDDDVVVMPMPRGGRGNSAAVRSIIIDSDSDEESYIDSGSAAVSSARTGAIGYGRMSDLEPEERGGGRGGDALKSICHDDEAEEAEESDSGDDLFDCRDDSRDEEEGEELGEEDSDEEHEMNFGSEVIPLSKCRERAFLEFSAIDIVPLMDTARETGSDYADCTADKENKCLPVNIAFRGPVHRPPHSVTVKQKREYNQRVLEAQSSEGRQELEPALESYLAALEICDSDPALHGKMAFLSRELDFF